MGAGCSASKPKEEQHPAVGLDWGLKAEATRIFKLGDTNANGYLELEELRRMMKNPRFVATAMENMDFDKDGRVSLTEWLISMKGTFDKSEAACKTALKAHAKAIEASQGQATPPLEMETTPST